MSNMKFPNSDEILKFMKKPSYRPMRARDISRRLGVGKESRKALKQILRRLIQEGVIIRIKGGRYKISQEDLKGEISHSPQPTVRVPMEGKILGKFVRTGKTGVILPRNRKIPPLPIRRDEVKGIRSGSLVLVEVRRAPKPGGHLSASVIDVLGKSGNLDVEKKGLFVEYNLPERFPSEAMRETNEIPHHILPQDLEGRVDLRGNLNVTIDNDRAKDFDDAVCTLRTDYGYRLWVSIADVAHYVKIGSAIDNEALQRGTSIYLPESVVPMLPERLSDWMCSLVQGEDRLTKTVEMDFDQQGVMVDFKIYNSVIRSRARLTYTEVSHIVEKKGRVSSTGSLRGGKRDSRLVESLKVMKELYERLRERRLERGGIDFDIPEPELIRDELGRTVDIVKSERNVAHGIIEEFMITANRAVAEYIFYSKVPSIYRIHEPPDIGSIKELALALRNLGYFLHIGGKIRAADIQQLILEAKGEPEEIAVNTLILRSMKRAIYSSERRGHFGLAIDHYTHFTSPIRRYPDLVVHRIVNSIINKRRLLYDEESLDWIAAHSSTRERFADEVEREAIKLERVYMMKSHVRKEFEGFVISVLPYGIFVELKEIFVEGFIPREKMRNRGRRFDIGQRVRVRVIESDVERRRITLELIE
jgi:ribonuclease R